jgi:hypothetical protein
MLNDISVTTLFHGDSDAGSPDVFVYEHGFTFYYSASAVLYIVDSCMVSTLSLVKGNLQDDAG